MSGHYRMQRRWMEHPAFGQEPFTRAQAWCWLIEKAAWKDHTQPLGKDLIPVRRSEYATSVRFLAERWRWTRMKAQRFLTRLEDHGMIEKSGTANGTASGTPYTVIRVCNYDKYQVVGDEDGTANGTASGTTAGRPRDKLEEGREEGREEGNHKYAFAGIVIRLNQTDFDRWQSTFVNIPNLRALLESRDAWLAEEPAKVQRKWFQSTPAYLANKDVEFATAKRAEEIDHLDGVEI